MVWEETQVILYWSSLTICETFIYLITESKMIKLVQYYKYEGTASSCFA